MNKLYRYALSLLFIFTGTPAFADIAYELSGYVGYTILGVKTIVKSVSKDDNDVSEGAFRGCAYGRIIVFSDNTYLKCATYNYNYSYRPSAVILSNGSSYIMIVDDDVYQMTR